MGKKTMMSYKLVMPEDMNPYGFLFGGKMLMWIDEVTSIAVMQDYPGLAFVTVGMSESVFKKSVPPRSILRFDSTRKRIGTTSVTYHVDVYSRPAIGKTEEEHVFHTDITFVHVGKDGRKQPIG